ncbi:MAG: hypothetical protein AABX31_04130 [Nanoarchaeota archaeon]
MSRIKTLDLLLSALEDHPVNEWQKKELYHISVRAKETKRCNWGTTPFSLVPYTFHAYQTEKGEFQISLIKGLTGTALRYDDGSIIHGDYRGNPDLYLLAVDEKEIPVLRALTFDNKYSKSYSAMWEGVLNDNSIQPYYERVDSAFTTYQNELKQKRENRLRAFLE